MNFRIFVLIGSIVFFGCTDKLDIKHFEKDIPDTISLQLAIAETNIQKGIREKFPLMNVQEPVGEEYERYMDGLIEILERYAESRHDSGKTTDEGYRYLLGKIVDRGAADDPFVDFRDSLELFHYKLAFDLLRYYPEEQPLTDGYTLIAKTPHRRVYSTTETRTGIEFEIEVIDVGDAVDFIVTPVETT